MQYDPPLTKATLLKRYKRFLADVQLEDGQILTAHCANTGAMTGCAEPGFTAWLHFHNNPKRKLPCSWVLAENHRGEMIGIDTHMANELVHKALLEGRLEPLSGYDTVKREVSYGTQRSRIDFLLASENRRDCYVEVKSVTLCTDGHTGLFPDTVTDRGRKHLLELTEMARQGHRVVLIYCVQHTGIQHVSLQNTIDPAYTETLLSAQQQGLEIYAFGCELNQKNSYINQQLPVEM
ncbi:DNA/RNA nuclease SfsA [Aestuariibacter salexigens]|uniref:DNA/RNA nuclease SfsA n=1 Tax=Aestuariibacter salexigens TaxID=226010 RepID=UPI00041465BB|nr:DNA/RNA nuclease SfsA [Aestuariibacter salexigens]